MKSKKNKSGDKIIQDSNLFSNSIFTSMANSAPFMIWVADQTGKIIYFNKPWLDFTGRTLEQEMDSEWTKSIHQADLELYNTTYTENFDKKSEYSVEYRLKRYDNEYYWILEKGAPIYREDGNFSGFLGSCFNIEALKKFEEKFHKEGELYKNLVESLTEAVILSDINDHIIFANKRLCDITGYSLEEIIGHSPYNLFFTSQDWEKVREKTKQRYSGVSDRYEVEILRKDKSTLWVSISGSPYKNSQGKIIGTIGAISDITENIQARSFLEKSENKYRSVVEQVREVIFQTDAEGNITFINPFWTEITGYTNEETIGKNILDYIHSDDKKYCVDQFVNIIYQKKPFARFITRFKTKNNQYRWVELNSIGRWKMGLHSGSRHAL